MMRIRYKNQHAYLAKLVYEHRLIENNTASGVKEKKKQRKIKTKTQENIGTKVKRKERKDEKKRLKKIEKKTKKQRKKEQKKKNGTLNKRSKT